MLIFVVPLQSPAASRDWSRVSRLAERCLRSICGQTSPEFRVVLVCNQSPIMSFDHPALTVIEEPFPVPAAGVAARMADKWRKLHRGLVCSRQWGPAYVMYVDADDCVSARLARFVEQAPASVGWSLDTGYMYEEGSRWLFLRRERFHQYCGTSSILYCRQEDFPSSMNEPRKGYFALCHGHKRIVEHMRSVGTPLRRLPFIGAVYVAGTGENCSGVSMRAWGKSKGILLEKLSHSRPLTRSLRREFGLYRLD